MRETTGVGVWGPGTKIINLVIHDTGQGLAPTSVATNSEYYGNIIYYNGWSAPDRGHGHAIYAQNYDGGSKLIKHNIMFDQFSYNLHAYGSSTAGFMNSRVEGNVWWRGTSLVGGESGFDIGGTSVTGNFCWVGATGDGVRDDGLRQRDGERELPDEPRRRDVRAGEQRLPGR